MTRQGKVKPAGTEGRGEEEMCRVQDERRQGERRGGGGGVVQVDKQGGGRQGHWE